MRLKSLKLTHFRSCRDTTVVPIDEAMNLLALVASIKADKQSGHSMH